MCSGYGFPVYFVALFIAGSVLFDVAGVGEEVSKEALTKAMHKLPVKCKIVKREVEGGNENEI